MMLQWVADYQRILGDPSTREWRKADLENEVQLWKKQITRHGEKIASIDGVIQEKKSALSSGEYR